MRVASALGAATMLLSAHGVGIEMRAFLIKEAERWKEYVKAANSV